MGEGDFLSLLKTQGYQLGTSVFPVGGNAAASRDFVSAATTILAFKYRSGVLVAGDRRATAGTTVMYDRAD
ncbi:MAG: proteasome subunit alpha, partial [Nitrospiria bacterium]